MNSSSSLKKYYFILEGSKKYKIKEKEPFLARRLPLLMISILFRLFFFFFIKKTRKFLYRLFRSFFILFYSFLFLFPPFFSSFHNFSLDFYCGRDVVVVAVVTAAADGCIDERGICFDFLCFI